MNDIDITLYLNEYRVRALAEALGSQTAETVEDNVADLASIKSIEIEDCILRSADDPLADKHPFTGKVCFHQTHAER